MKHGLAAVGGDELLDVVLIDLYFLLLDERLDDAVGEELGAFARAAGLDLKEHFSTLRSELDEISRLLFNDLAVERAVGRDDGAEDVADVAGEPLVSYAGGAESGDGAFAGDEIGVFSSAPICL